MDEKREITHELINALAKKAREKSTQGYKALAKLTQLTQLTQLTPLQRRIFFAKSVHRLSDKKICDRLKISEKKLLDESVRLEKKLIPRKIKKR